MCFLCLDDDTMPDPGSFYIVTVAGGKCLENTQGAQGVLDCLPKDKSGQHWTIETGEDENTVAFQSCVDGQYLRNNEPNKINWGRIGMGEKQWWTLEKGHTPGSWLIRSPECKAGASYLNDFQGKYQDRNYVHMWQMNVGRTVLIWYGIGADVFMQEPLIFWLEWYFVDANRPPFNPAKEGGEKSSQVHGVQQPSNGIAQTKDLEQREAALKKREQQLKDLEQREAALRKKEQDLKKKEQELKKLSQQPATPANKPQINGVAPAKDCGHKVYSPPRKLNRKIVGYLYEGSSTTPSVRSRA